MQINGIITSEEFNHENNKATQILAEIEKTLKSKKLLAGMDWTHATGPKGKITGRADKFSPMDHPEWVGIKDDPKNKNKDETESSMPSVLSSKSPNVLGKKVNKVRTSIEFRDMDGKISDADYTLKK